MTPQNDLVSPLRGPALRLLTTRLNYLTVYIVYTIKCYSDINASVLIMISMILVAGANGKCILNSIIGIELQYVQNIHKHSSYYFQKPWIIQNMYDSVAC